ncbi:MAG: NUDIX domain-containing protein [bacterium]
MRAPFQILVFPFIREGDDYHYAIFKRADFHIWQALSGGGENDETPVGAMKREVYEEIGVNAATSSCLRLSSLATIPAEYVGGLQWGVNQVMIPEITFGLEMSTREFQLSHEHTEYLWLSFQEAMEKLKYDSNKSALWELNYRLHNNQAGIEQNKDTVSKYYLEDYEKF